MNTLSTSYVPHPHSPLKTSLSIHFIFISSDIDEYAGGDFIMEEWGSGAA